MKINDAIPGARIGRLVIVELLEERNKHGKRYVRCVCDCNKKIKLTLNNIGNSVHSCGCYKVDNIIKIYSKEPRHTVAVKVLNDMRKVDKGCNVSLNSIKKLIYSKCFYCDNDVNTVGIETRTKNSSKIVVKRLGIDRINNEIGYCPENIVACCFKCNYIKSNWLPDEILKYFPKISKNAFNLVNHIYEPQNYDNIVIEHTDKCQCYTNPHYSVSLEDRISKIARASSMNNRSRKVNVTLEYIKKIIFSDKCFYCERPTSEVGNASKRNGYGANLCVVRWIGIDRVDTSMNYDSGNMVPCCGDCNSTKRDNSVQMLAERTNLIHNKILVLNNKGTV